jgi:hypothetical protein
VISIENGRRPARKLTPTEAASIKKRLKDGVLQHRIAAEFDVNSGRISEINTGKRFQDVPASS